MKPVDAPVQKVLQVIEALDLIGVHEHTPSHVVSALLQCMKRVAITNHDIPMWDACSEVRTAIEDCELSQSLNAIMSPHDPVES